MDDLSHMFDFHEEVCACKEVLLLEYDARPSCLNTLAFRYGHAKKVLLLECETHPSCLNALAF